MADGFVTKPLPPLRKAAGAGKMRPPGLRVASGVAGEEPVPDVTQHFPLTVVEKVRQDLYKQAEADAVDTKHGEKSLRRIVSQECTEEEHVAAKKARAADEACPDKLLPEAVRHLLLAHTAYRVPTGSDFWDRIKAIQNGASRATPGEVLRKYKKDTTTLLHNVHDFLRRVYLCTGHRHRLVACTQLDLAALEKIGAVEAAGGKPGAPHPRRQLPSAAEGFPVGCRVLVTAPALPLRVVSRGSDGARLYRLAHSGGSGGEFPGELDHRELRPARRFTAGQRVVCYAGCQPPRHGTVAGSCRGRVGVRVPAKPEPEDAAVEAMNTSILARFVPRTPKTPQKPADFSGAAPEHETVGFLQEDVYPAESYEPGAEVTHTPAPVMGTVVGHSRGRVGVRTRGGDVVGVLPDRVRRVQGGGATPGLWSLATSMGGSLGGLRVLASVQTDEEEEEARAHEEGKLIMKEAPIVPPGWLICCGEDDQTAVTICIAGTQNFNDCFRDCMFIPVQLELPPLPVKAGGKLEDKPTTPADFVGLKVHMGFLDGANRIYEQIMPALAKHRNEHKDLRVSFTGHSLGGATAMLLAAFLDAAALPGIRVESVFTFGAPNVLNIKTWDGAAPLLKQVRVQQYVNDRDVVPRALGSGIVRKLAKVGIRMGFKALACVTELNAETLPFYRFTTPTLHYLSARTPAGVEAIDDRTEQKKVLSLSLAGMRPQAAADHKMGAYIAKLMKVYDAATGFVHNYHLEPALTDGNTVGLHAIAGAVFDAKDPTVLSPSAAEACDDIHDRLGGVTPETLAALCHWSDKVYPESALRARVFSGAYACSPAPQRRASSAWAAPGGASLSKPGFSALVEDLCYTDLPWVARLLRCMGWQQDGNRLVKKKSTCEALRGAADVPAAAPFFRGVPLATAAGALTQPAAAAARQVFRRFARRSQAIAGSPGRKPIGVLRPECLRALLRAVEVSEFGDDVPRDEVRLAAASAASLDQLRTLNRRRLVDERGNVSEAGFLKLFHLWCVEDEVRVWGILVKGGGYNETLTTWDPAGSLWQVDTLDDEVEDNDAKANEEAARAETSIEDKLRRALYEMYRTGATEPPTNHPKKRKKRSKTQAPRGGAAGQPPAKRTVSSGPKGGRAKRGPRTVFELPAGTAGSPVSRAAVLRAAQRLSAREARLAQATYYTRSERLARVYGSAQTLDEAAWQPPYPVPSPPGRLRDRGVARDLRMYLVPLTTTTFKDSTDRQVLYREYFDNLYQHIEHNGGAKRRPAAAYETTTATLKRSPV
eukprot:gene22675-34708_t